jgi:hypothetical protein
MRKNPPRTLCGELCTVRSADLQCAVRMRTRFTESKYLQCGRVRSAAAMRPRQRSRQRPPERGVSEAQSARPHSDTRRPPRSGAIARAACGCGKGCKELKIAAEWALSNHATPPRLFTLLAVSTVADQSHSVITQAVEGATIMATTKHSHLITPPHDYSRNVDGR